MKWFALISWLAISTQAYAECTVTSGGMRVSLLELYTSEGCSSCPPADRWLSQLEQSGFKPTQVVPLAFHVDYWDYIGWKDRFAKAEFSDRQRQAARLQNSNSVYTPQFLLNGADFLSWFRENRLKDQLAKNHREQAAIEMMLRLSTAENRQLKLSTTIQPNSNSLGKNHDLYIAIYENGLKTAVKAGENSGRELTHDYVVRELYGPFKLGNLNQPWQQDIAIPVDWLQRNAGVVSFVQNRNTGEILQVTSLKMCS